MSEHEFASALLFVLGIAIGYWIGRYFRVLFGRRQDARWQSMLNEVHQHWREAAEFHAAMMRALPRARRRRVVFRWREAGQKADQAVRDGTGQEF